MVSIHEGCGGCRKLATELEDARHETLAVVERLLVSEDLARELSGRLLARYEELRRLRAVPDGFRGAAATNGDTRKPPGEARC